MSLWIIFLPFLLIVVAIIAIAIWIIKITIDYKRRITGKTSEMKNVPLHEKNRISLSNETQEELERQVSNAASNKKKGVNYVFAGGAVVFLSQQIMSREGGLLTVLGIAVMVVGILVAVIGLMVQHSARDEVRDYLGSEVIPVMLSQVFEDMEYEKNGYIDAGLIKSIDMSFPFQFDDVIGSDHVQGIYRGVNVELSDIRLETVFEYTVTDKDGQTKTEEKRRTMFQGQWLILDFHKELSADLCVFEGGRKRSCQIETENVAFNEKFGVSCDSAHDAFYILTPHMMEHLMAMEKQTGGDIYLRFLKKGKVHVAINSGRDIFEEDNFEHIKGSELLQRFRSEVGYITDLIDTLLTVDTLYKQQDLQS